MKMPMRIALVYVSAFTVILFISFGMAGSLTILYVKDWFGLDSITPVALYLTISFTVSTIMMFFAGHLYDKWGPVAPLLLALLSIAVWTLCVNTLARQRVWDSARWLWYTAGALNGLALSSAIMGVNPTLMRINPSKRGLSVSVSQTAMALAMVVWSNIITVLAVRMGIFSALTVAGLVNVAVILMSLTVFRGLAKVIPPDSRGRTAREARPGNLNGESKPGQLMRLLVQVFLMVLSVALSSMALVQFLAGLVEESFARLAMAPEEVRTTIVPTVMTIAGLAQAVSAVLWGYAIDRFGPLRAIPIVYSLETISSVIAYMLVFANPWIAAGFIVARLAFFGAEPVAHWVLIPVVFGSANLGKISGIVNSAPMVAALISPVISGLIRDSIGSYSYILLVSAILSTVALAAYFYLISLQRKREKRALQKASSVRSHIQSPTLTCVQRLHA